MEFMTTKEAVQKWNISERRIRQLLQGGRIEGAVKVGNNWNIPIHANKPVDKRSIKLNNTDIPLFMRWGNDRELIIQKADELCKMVKEKIKNDKLDIGYIEGANHSYTGKEEILANEIQNFLREIVE